MDFSSTPPHRVREESLSGPAGAPVDIDSHSSRYFAEQQEWNNSRSGSSGQPWVRNHHLPPPPRRRAPTTLRPSSFVFPRLALVGRPRSSHASSLPRGTASSVRSTTIPTTKDIELTLSNMPIVTNNYTVSPDIVKKALRSGFFSSPRAHHPVRGEDLQPRPGARLNHLRLTISTNPRNGLLVFSNPHCMAIFRGVISRPYSLPTLEEPLIYSPDSTTVLFEHHRQDGSAEPDTPSPPASISS